MSEIQLSTASQMALKLETRALDLVRFGANAATIKDLLGSVPKSAQHELGRMQTDFKKSRMGKDASFLHQVPEAFPISNKLWAYYSILSNDPSVKLPLQDNIDKMLDAYARVFDESSEDIRAYVNFNRFVQLLHRIGDGTIHIFKCECGTKYIGHTERPGTGCAHCRAERARNRRKAKDAEV
ncbi:hypothetical protein AB4559_04785 [Vibrio sp. 10N.222.51.C8]|uniref:hypothetical protein n=1 Tax=unclassified Vibrio TaxID=2614977 RepID=UPI003551CC2A